MEGALSIVDPKPSAGVWSLKIRLENTGLLFQPFNLKPPFGFNLKPGFVFELLLSSVEEEISPRHSKILLCLQSLDTQRQWEKDLSCLNFAVAFPAECKLQNNWGLEMLVAIRNGRIKEKLFSVNNHQTNHS